MDNLDEILGKLLEWLEATESFAIEQVPLALQEILMWKSAEAVAVMVICFAVVAAYLLVLANADKPLVKEEADFIGIFTIVGAILCAFPFIIFLDFLFDLLQIYFAPRVYLIEYLTRFQP